MDEPGRTTVLDQQGIWIREIRMNMIPYGRQLIDEDDISAVTAVLKSDYLTQGPKVAEFEKAICDYTGAKYCVAVANGTAALHIAVAALDLQQGCEGITSPITFTASANSMIYCGIRPVFADIDPATYNISPESIEKKITSKTRLLTPVHFAGQPADMVKISEIAKKKRTESYRRCSTRYRFKI